MPIKKGRGKKEVGQSFKAAPKDLRAPALPPASDVVVKRVDGTILRTEPALTTSPGEFRQASTDRAEETETSRAAESVHKSGYYKARAHQGQDSKEEALCSAVATPQRVSASRSRNHIRTAHRWGLFAQSRADGSRRDPQEPRRGQVVDRISMPAGEGTNNTAEYQGLIEGLKLAHKHGAQHLHVYMDSSFVRDSVVARRGSKKAHLKVLHSETLQLVQRFDAIEISRIPREMNSEADGLAGAPLGIAPGANVIVGKMPARLERPCRWCGHNIQVGDTICRMQDGGIWVCEDCAHQMSRPSGATV